MVSGYRWHPASSANIAEYCTRCSSGISASTASISELLPAADLDCTITASGVSISRDTAAR